MQRPKIGRLFASQADTSRRDPGDAKYGLGWVAEIPTLQVLNFLQYRVDSFLLALAERGVTSWGGDVTYTKGALAFDDATGVIYVSTVANPDTTKAPNANPSQWTKSASQISRDEFDSISASISSHIANLSNPHKLTPKILGTYTTAEIDALVKTLNAQVLAHVQDKNNPHKVTAAQAGAVPITGGTYTGPVTFNNNNILLGNGNQIIADNRGLSFQNGNKALTVDNNGNLRVTTTGAAIGNKVLLDNTYPDYRAAQESSYQVPQPTFFQPFMGGLDMPYGDGTCNTSWEPTYKYGMLLASGDVSYDNTVPPVGCTWSFDVLSDFTGATTKAATFNLGVVPVWLGSAGDVRLSTAGSVVSLNDSVLNNISITNSWVDGSEFGTVIYQGSPGASATNWQPTSPKFTLNPNEDLVMSITLTLDADGTVQPMVRTDGNGVSNHQILFDTTDFKAGVPQTLNRTATNTGGNSGYFQVNHLSFTGTVTINNAAIYRRSKVLCQLYVNGVFAQSVTTDYSAPAMAFSVQDVSSDIYISNLRAWGVPLTSKQVSNI